MACIIEPQLGHNGERLKWNPTKIPSTKPFIHITTSACDALSTSDNMNFVKTKSLIYSPFHSIARYINFEIGYSRESKWLEYLADKWNDFANFFVAGFLEAVYSTDEGDTATTYVQIDAKLIDYDVRFRTSSTSSSTISSPKSLNNAFAQRRNKSTSNNSPNRRSITSRSDSATKSDSTKSDNELEDTIQHDNTITIDDDESVEPPRKNKKRQLSDLCNTDNEAIDEVLNVKPKKTYNKKGGRGGRGKK
jgi:Sec7-like guanine-nucleotide exchange factor